MIGEVLNIGESNKRGHIAISKIERRRGMIYYVNADGFVMEYKPLGRPKKVKVDVIKASDTIV